MVGGQHDDPGVRELRANGDRGLDAAHLRHLEVHEHDVRTVLAEERQRLGAVAALPDQGDVRVVSERSRDAFAHHRVIVHQEDTNRAHSRLLRPAAPRTGQASHRHRGLPSSRR